jgi:hypothetical protein
VPVEEGRKTKKEIPFTSIPKKIPLKIAKNKRIMSTERGCECIYKK